MNTKHIDKVKKHLIELVDNWPVKTICLTAAIILYFFHWGSLMESRYIAVPLSIENTGRLVPAENYPEKIKVRLWGENSNVDSLREEDVTAFIDISRFEIPDIYRIPIQVRLAGTAVAIDTLEVTPEPASLSLKLEEGMTKRIPVVLSLRGKTADGYELLETSIDTPITEIRGPVSLAESIDSLMTEPLSIEARTTGFSGAAAILNKNPLISILGTKQVHYTVKISEIISEKTFDAIPLSFEKLQESFTISTDQKIGSVAVSGPKKQLDIWRAPAKLLTVSCDSITEPGTYTLPVVPDIAAGNTKIHITRFTPKSVQIKVIPVDNKGNKDDEDDSRARY